MGTIIQISDAVKDTISTVLSDLMGELDKECTLYYPDKFFSCLNCVFDSIGRKSSNHYKSGGPIPFPNGSACPMCNGTGKRAEPQTENVHFRCIWNPNISFARLQRKENAFLKDVNVLTVPYSILKIRGFIADGPKVLRADRLLVQLPIAPYVKAFYRRITDMEDPFNIVQNKYFICYLERIQ